MVFKPFTNLARQSFAKHLVNGSYAQSVVAATQSSYATTTAVPFARSSQVPQRINNAFGNAGSKAPHGSGNGSENVANFHAVPGADDADDKQKRYLFSKKILWSKAQHQTGVLQAQEQEKPRSLSQSRSFSAVALDAEAREELAALEGDENAIEDSVEASREAVEDLESETSEYVVSESAKSASTAATDVSVDAELSELEASSKWEEIERVFAQRIKDGVEPTTAAYNHLLSAAISRGTDEATITKVLNIFQDVVSKQVTPDTTTYTKIINFLTLAAKDRFKETSEVEQANATFSFNGIVPTRVPSNGREVMGYAVGLFYQGMPRQYDVKVYKTLLEGCASFGMTTDMVNIFEWMESSGVKATYPVLMAMLRGFSELGDIDSALEVYKEISREPAKFLEEHGQLDEMFAHMLNTYIVAGKLGTGLDFFKRIVESEITDTTTLNRLIGTMVVGFAKRGDHSTAYDWFLKLVGQSHESRRLQLISQALMESTKTSNVEFAHKWFDLLSAELLSSSEFGLSRDGNEIMSAVAAYLALAVKENRMKDCEDIWVAYFNYLSSVGLPAAPVALYANYLAETGHVDKGIAIVKEFGKAYDFAKLPYNVREYDAAAFGGMFDSLVRARQVSPQQLISFARAASDTGLVFGPETAKNVLSSFDESALGSLNWNDVEFLLRFVGLNLPHGKPSDFTIQRLQYVLDYIMNAGIPLEGNTQEIVNIMLGRIGNVFGAEYLARWSHFLDTASAAVLPVQHAAPTAYAFTDVDIRKSKQLMKAAEQTNDFNEIMSQFNASRKSGSIFLASAYSKLIARAQRDNRYDAVFAIYNAAESDLPLDIAKPNSIEAWTGIYDSMIAAELHRSDFEAAKFFHHKLATIGGVASANTYGLYIVSLKQSQDLYDEATEAVQIMERAKSEGVIPTPFLYNAVIGRLARARRIDDCLYYFSEMRRLNLRPTSVTYGTMINALCRVSDERFAEELFEEMEAQANYKPRAAPYNSMMQYFTTMAKRDRSKVLDYYNRMLARGIKPTSHTYKLLIEAYAELPPPNLNAAKAVMDTMRANNEEVLSAHHAVIIHAMGCVLSDPDGALEYFNSITTPSPSNPHPVQEDNILYQSLLESLVANHRTKETPSLIKRMAAKNVQLTPYIANTLIHGWARERDLGRVKQIYDCVGPRREPSTYETMTRALLSLEDREGARAVVSELLSRGYPAAVTGKIVELLRGGGEYDVVVSA